MTFLFLIVILGATDSARAGRLRADRDRPGADADPPDQHPGHQHLGEPGAQHRPGAVRRRLGAAQLWLFWVAPIIGGVLGGFVYKAARRR